MPYFRHNEGHSPEKQLDTTDIDELNTWFDSILNSPDELSNEILEEIDVPSTGSENVDELPMESLFFYKESNPLPSASGIAEGCEDIDLHMIPDLIPNSLWSEKATCSNVIDSSTSLGDMIGYLEREFQFTPPLDTVTLLSNTDETQKVNRSLTSRKRKLDELNEKSRKRRRMPVEGPDICDANESLSDVIGEEGLGNDTELEIIEEVIIEERLGNDTELEILEEVIVEEGLGNDTELEIIEEVIVEEVMPQAIADGTPERIVPVPIDVPYMLRLTEKKQYNIRDPESSMRYFVLLKVTKYYGRFLV